MHTRNGQLILSATDLSDFLACRHLTQNSLAKVFDGVKPPVFEDPGAEVLRARGEEHEGMLLDGMKAGGIQVAEITRGDEWPKDWSRLAQDALAAMKSGADVIYQGVLFDGRWLGLPDFLTRVERPGERAAWSYEVIDAKLAREAKAGAVLQITLYSDLLAQAQGTEPERMHLALGGPDKQREAFLVSDYSAFYRSIRRQFEDAIDRDNPPNTYPDPVAHCDVCAWNPICRKRRVDDDHLSLVAGISRRCRDQLVDRRVETVASLGSLELPVRPCLDGVSDSALERVREQARIQVEGREAGEPRYEFLEPVVPEQGLAALPEPTDGDLFFDIEGDPHALEVGLEYLFGYCDRTGRYIGLWALDRAREKEMFERFIDTVTERLQQQPDLHIYHYAAYETTAVKKLAHRYGTREEDVDRLLRGKVFVDLYRVVRQGIRASVESYSIKKMEPFYGFDREQDLREANHALSHFEAWLSLRDTDQSDQTLLDQIEAYNRDDCVSTLRLQEWLESLRLERAEQVGEEVPRPERASGDAPEQVAADQDRTDELISQLVADVPVDEQERSSEQRARWLLAQLLGWHRREKKSMWWEYFRLLERTSEELTEERGALGGLEYDGVVDTIKRSHVHRYRFPPQEYTIGEGSKVTDPATGKPAGVIEGVDVDNRTIDLKRAITSPVPHPQSLVPLDNISDALHRERLLGIAELVVANGIDGPGELRAARDLLLPFPPRVGQSSGAALVEKGADPLSAAKELVLALNKSVLPLQGPPGSGKTYTGARMIVELVRAGKRVGVTATSHKVIGNLLEAVYDAAVEQGVSISGIQKVTADATPAVAAITGTTDNAEVAKALSDGSALLAAGTAWLWVREEMTGSVDVLFVDEAGQMSLANVLAVAAAADSLVLLGDPQQLEQPQKGIHPEGADASALEHILGNEATMPPDKGMFLEHTWRLHPDICLFTSEMFYRNRLRARPGLDGQIVTGPGSITGSGLRYAPVHHSGNRNASSQEVEWVKKAVGALCADHEWTDQDGVSHPLTLEDVLVVAPYNVQVEALTTALPLGARVGTVDRFQGQEAPVVIYSLTSSTAEDAPRGMEFLYNPNRLNVATSRARCLAVVVGNPELFTPNCKSPRQMRLANAFCRLVELAGCP
jgi:uncharacterized protein